MFILNTPMVHGCSWSLVPNMGRSPAELLNHGFCERGFSSICLMSSIFESPTIIGSCAKRHSSLSSPEIVPRVAAGCVLLPVQRGRSWGVVLVISSRGGYGSNPGTLLFAKTKVEQVIRYTIDPSSKWRPVQRSASVNGFGSVWSGIK